ncbi:MAG: glutamate-5-semialdehyde dehydrogenase [Candidatus Azobacteroides sp.]|nr:glutamate-5-semialdehyde dehydrogenase [Candidatus Azobacteroides sp.]
MNDSLLFQESQRAVGYLCSLDTIIINKVLYAIGDAVLEQKDRILSENGKDLERMDCRNPKYDRLRLTPERIDGIASSIVQVAHLPSPVGRVLKETFRPNGMKITKVSVPFGVIGIIYEARPNVSVEVFSLCFKSGNACVLKGGSDAEFSNQVLVDIIRNVLKQFSIPEACCILLPPEREATAVLLNAYGIVDLIIPRGSQSLIQYVRTHTQIPVIETGAGICHTYFDLAGNKEMGRNVIFNAKTRRVSVCNALDCLIIHEERLSDLPFLCEKLAEKQVILYADEKAYRTLSTHYPEELLQHATEESFGTEFLDYKMSIKTVLNREEALEHIARYSSKHSECILTEDPATIHEFQTRVDAACVYSNVSTAFTDGEQFGLGAEIGISTQKLHARGPMALEELTSYKWIIQGEGQIRP